MKRRRNSILMLTAVPLIAIGLAACGGSSKSSTSSSSPASNTAVAASASGATVSTMSVSGTGTALVDSKGNVLYTNDKDTASMVACTGSCTSIWVPVAAPSGGKPTSDDSAVQAKLGVVKSPDGGSQVTYGGKPLYTFVQDSPGQATGNGFMDSFGGTSFTWTVATASGKASSSGGSTSTAAPAAGGTSSSGGSASQSSGGYGY